MAIWCCCVAKKNPPERVHSGGFASSEESLGEGSEALLNGAFVEAKKFDGAVVLQAMHRDLDGAQQLFGDFAQRAVTRGIEVGLCPAKGDPLQARVRLTKDLQQVILQVGERERCLPLTSIVRAAPGLTAGQLSARAHLGPKAATIELDSGEGVVVVCKSQGERHELVLCLTLLADAAACNAVRFVNGDSEFSAEEEDEDEAPASLGTDQARSFGATGATPDKKAMAGSFAKK